MTKDTISINKIPKRIRNLKNFKQHLATARKAMKAYNISLRIALIRELEDEYVFNTYRLLYDMPCSCCGRDFNDHDGDDCFSDEEWREIIDG